MTDQSRRTRRDFLKNSTLAAAAGTMPYWFTSASAFAWKSSTERPILGCIGTGSRWGSVGPSAMQYADCVAVCDVDANHAGGAKDRVQKQQPGAGADRSLEVHEDYRKILDRKDVDVVTIVTPDHWHSKIAIEAMQAGKDVYCEKPLTLTIDEGKQIIKTLDETKRVFQVGTQQRTEMKQNFLQAIGIIREGRIGDVKKITCNIGGPIDSGPIPVAEVPKGLNWDMWLGQAPKVDYRALKKEGKRRGFTRCHYEFRWWYEYSGGKMTDWGAHHVDIAQWAIEQNGIGQGVVSVEPVMAEHPTSLLHGVPMESDRYNTATKFHVRCMFANGVEMNIVSNSPDGNGILFEGTRGRFHVSRGRMKGRPAEDLKDKPISEDTIAAVYKGKIPPNGPEGNGRHAHMQNFIECLATREQPVSDVHSHHRAMTTCHLANIAIRLGRTLKWDPKTEQIVGDPAANQWLSREQRKGYEIEA